MARQEPHYLKDFAVFALILCSGLLSTVDLHGEDYLGHMFREIGKTMLDPSAPISVPLPWLRCAHAYYHPWLQPVFARLQDCITSH